MLCTACACGKTSHSRFTPCYKKLYYLPQMLSSRFCSSSSTPTLRRLRTLNKNLLGCVNDVCTDTTLLYTTLSHTAIQPEPPNKPRRRTSSGENRFSFAFLSLCSNSKHLGAFVVLFFFNRLNPLCLLSEIWP